MGEICGPFSMDDFQTMNGLREDIIWMKNKDADKFRVCIQKEADLLKPYLSRKAA